MLLRATFLSFSISLIAFAIVLAAIGGLPNGPMVSWVPLLVAVSVVSIISVHLLMRKPLACESEATLATSYRKRFFAMIAMTEYVALFAFVFTFIGGPAWIYDAPGAFTLIRFWTTSAPTQSALRRDQDALNAQRMWAVADGSDTVESSATPAVEIATGLMTSIDCAPSAAWPRITVPERE